MRLREFGSFSQQRVISETVAVLLRRLAHFAGKSSGAAAVLMASEQLRRTSLDKKVAEYSINYRKELFSTSRAVRNTYRAHRTDSHSNSIGSSTRQNGNSSSVNPSSEGMDGGP